jgi:hypothetical protein
LLDGLAAFPQQLLQQFDTARQVQGTFGVQADFGTFQTEGGSLPTTAVTIAADFPLYIVTSQLTAHRFVQQVSLSGGIPGSADGVGHTP